VSRVWPKALTTAAQDRFVLLSAEAAARLEAFCITDGDDREAGGLLLGLRRDPHLEITVITLPSPHDLRQRHRFVRQCDSHQRRATAAWQSSGGLIDYVGEWHTHPEAIPSPSGTDYKSLLMRSKQHRSETLVEIIIGWEHITAAMVVANSYQLLIPV
jgi:integrative and conjugative element protein (TIGR02256 family)